MVVLGQLKAIAAVARHDVERAQVSRELDRCDSDVDGPGGLRSFRVHRNEHVEARGGVEPQHTTRNKKAMRESCANNSVSNQCFPETGPGLVLGDQRREFLPTEGPDSQGLASFWGGRQVQISDPDSPGLRDQIAAGLRARAEVRLQSVKNMLSKNHIARSLQLSALCLCLSSSNGLAQQVTSSGTSASLGSPSVSTSSGAQFVGGGGTPNEILYRYDDGVIGLTYGGHDGESVWMAGYDAGSGVALTQVSTLFGLNNGNGGFLSEGLPAKFVIWDDPTNDYDPSDAQVLWSQDTFTANVDTGIPLNISVFPPVTVTGVFFVGIWCQHSSLDFPATADGSNDSNGTCYYARGFSNPVDLNDLSGADSPPMEYDSFVSVGGVAPVWAEGNKLLLRAGHAEGLAGSTVQVPVLFDNYSTLKFSKYEYGVDTSDNSLLITGDSLGADAATVAGGSPPFDETFYVAGSNWGSDIVVVGGGFNLQPGTDLELRVLEYTIPANATPGTVYVLEVGDWRSIGQSGNSVPIRFLSDVDGATSPALVNGTITVSEPPILPYCFGDGSGTACPCMNGDLGKGCPTSASNGATLLGLGNPEFAGDSFQLLAVGMPPGKPGLAIKGSSQAGSGLGNNVGDGLLCAIPQRRSQVLVSNASGEVSMTNWRGQPFGTAAGVANVGAPTYYQWWFRDATFLCTGNGFNFTNGVRVNWE